MESIRIEESSHYRIMVSFPYNPDYISKVKSIVVYRWHPEERLQSFPNISGMLEKILKVFEGEMVYVKSSLQSKYSLNMPFHGFEDLRRELISKQYEL